MTNGSTSGRASSNSSTRAMRMVREVEEAQRSAAPFQGALRLEVEQSGDEAVARVKDEGVQRPRRARPVRGRVPGERQLEEGVQLDAVAAAPGVLQDHSAGADVAGACQADRRTGGRGDGGGVCAENAQIAIAQVPTSIRHAPLDVEQPIEAYERVGVAAGVHHLELE